MLPGVAGKSACWQSVPQRSSDRVGGTPGVVSWEDTMRVTPAAFVAMAMGVALPESVVGFHVMPSGDDQIVGANEQLEPLGHLPASKPAAT